MIRLRRIPWEVFDDERAVGPVAPPAKGRGWRLRRVAFELFDDERFSFLTASPVPPIPPIPPRPDPGFGTGLDGAIYPMLLAQMRKRRHDDDDIAIALALLLS